MKAIIGIITAGLLTLGCTTINNLIYYNDDTSISFTLADSVQLYPFQVLHVDSAYSNTKNNGLIQWEIVRYDDTLSVIDGHLILVHFGGAFISFEEGETIIVNQLVDKAKLRSYQNFDPNFPISSDIRPTIGHLFSYEDISLSSGHNHYNPFTILYPSETLEIGKNENICIRWNSEDDSLRNNSYKITIYNISDEPLDTISSDKNYLEFSAMKYFDKLEGDSLLLVGIEDSFNSGFDRKIGIWILDNSIAAIDLCNIQDPALAVQIAHYLEFEGHILGSLDMLLLANKLHPYSVYQKLPIAFKERNNL